MKKSELKQLVREVINEATAINCEPNWKNLYRFFLHIKKTDPKQFEKMKAAMGESEWNKLVKIATQTDK